MGIVNRTSRTGGASCARVVCYSHLRFLYPLPPPSLFPSLTPLSLASFFPFSQLPPTPLLSPPHSYSPSSFTTLLLLIPCTPIFPPPSFSSFSPLLLSSFPIPYHPLPSNLHSLCYILSLSRRFFSSGTIIRGPSSLPVRSPRALDDEPLDDVGRAAAPKPRGARGGGARSRS